MVFEITVHFDSYALQNFAHGEVPSIERTAAPATQPTNRTPSPYLSTRRQHSSGIKIALVQSRSTGNRVHHIISLALRNFRLLEVPSILTRSISVDFCGAGKRF